MSIAWQYKDFCVGDRVELQTTGDVLLPARLSGAWGRVCGVGAKIMVTALDHEHANPKTVYRVTPDHIRTRQRMGIAMRIGRCAIALCTSPDQTWIASTDPQTHFFYCSTCYPVDV